MSPEEVKEWAMQAVAPWGSDVELLADVFFAWKKEMDECIHVWNPQVFLWKHQTRYTINLFFDLQRGKPTDHVFDRAFSQKNL
jgi:hypothetical protein